MNTILTLLDNLSTIRDSNSNEYKRILESLSNAVYNYILYYLLWQNNYLSFRSVTGFEAEEAANIMSFKVVSNITSLINENNTYRRRKISVMCLSSFYDYLRYLKRYNDRITPIDGDLLDYVGMNNTNHTTYIVKKTNKEESNEENTERVCNHETEMVTNDIFDDNRDDLYNEDYQEPSGHGYIASPIEEYCIDRIKTLSISNYVGALLSTPLHCCSSNDFVSMIFLWLGEYKPSELKALINSKESVKELLESVYERYGLILKNVFSIKYVNKICEAFLSISPNTKMISKCANKYLTVLKKNPYIFCSDKVALMDSLEIGLGQGY